ncbi:cysteine desulfurase-like protein [Candidatus Bipolaricaulota bacterium]|nr:cysteine desulfurase-like protein [Candidatus Bipolaricaulota bacterium]
MQLKIEQLPDYLRDQFPSLENRTPAGYQLAYLDGPGGYQVPLSVIRAVEEYFVKINANAEGSYSTSIATDEMLDGAREAFADFFGCDSDEVAFGANMTTLNFLLSQALVRQMVPGDRVIITEIDHEGNRAPWLHLKERGIIIDEVRVDTKTCTLDMDDYASKLRANTRVVAVNYASNAVGTITDVRRFVSMAKKVGAYTVVDAVHYAAHAPIDVKAIGCDFLLASVYKFFGPHVGVMYANKEALSMLRTLRVKPARPQPPYKIETGTLNHEGIAGAAAAVAFVADAGRKFAEGLAEEAEGLTGRRRDVVAGLLAFDHYEKQLTSYLIDGLSKLPEVTLYGPPAGHPRTSTVSFTYRGLNSRVVARYLDSLGILVWDGDFFATTLVERLGLKDQGGLVRIGIAPYNTKGELTRLLDALADADSLRKFSVGAAKESN